MAKIVVVEHECLLRAESRRVGPDIDDDVVDGAVGATHQLGLATAAASVHAANHALCGSRLRVLHERRRNARRAEIFVEQLGVERPGEQSAVIAGGTGHQHEYSVEFARFDAHGTMLA